MQLPRFMQSPRRRATELEMAAVLFESILGRRATEADLRAAAAGLTSARGLKNQIDAMLRSDEFAIMRTPHLLAESAKNYQGEKIFFLHVPKTAGTWLRLAFIEAMGIPALDRYVRVGSWEGYSEEFLKMWPLLVGHTNIKNFPKGDHRGVTVFRESRARVLSAFRQLTRSTVSPPIHFTQAQERNNRHEDAMLSNFSGWLDSAMHPLDLLTWHVSMDDGHDLPATKERGVNRLAHAKFLESIPESEIRQALDRGIKRIAIAEWQHNKEGMSKIVERAIQRPVAIKVQNANKVLPEQLKQQIHLTKENHRQLSVIAEKSQIVFDLAADRGLVAPLTREEADEQFEIAAERLGFKL